MIFNVAYESETFYSSSELLLHSFISFAIQVLKCTYTLCL